MSTHSHAESIFDKFYHRKRLPFHTSTPCGAVPSGKGTADVVAGNVDVDSMMLDSTTGVVPVCKFS